MNSMSKAELKLALINKTLPLLQDDDDEEDDNNNNKNNGLNYCVSVPQSESVENEELQFLLQHAKKRRTKRKRRRMVSIISEPSDDDETSTFAMKRALDIQANLTTEHPSFVKLMLPSHVSGGFWLGLPTGFCRNHMPESGSVIDLVDEEGKTSKCTYLVRKVGLSGGWRAFAVEHELKEGDVGVFQLIALSTFKVYIARKDNPDECEAALGLQTSDDCTGQEISDKRDDNDQTLTIPEDNNSESPSNSSNNHLRCEILDRIRFSDTTITFESIKSFNNFTIIVDDLVINSKFSEANRKKYYKLCCSQKSFLHENLLKGLNINLVVGIISETINISDGIKACTSSTSTDELQKWVKTLEAFEHLGMNVKFLRGKLIKMSGIAAARASATEKMKDVESKLGKLKGIMEKIGLEMEAEVTACTE